MERDDVASANAERGQSGGDLSRDVVINYAIEKPHTCVDLITSKQVKEVYSILKSRDIPRDTQTWNRRYREYMEKIKTGSVFEIAEVLRDLCVLRMTKELSFGERKMLETARGLLIKELAIAKGVGEDKISSEIDQIFAPAAA